MCWLVVMKVLFLRETPEDFMSTSNAFQTESDFEMSINNLYNLTRYEFMVMMNQSLLIIYMARILSLMEYLDQL